MKTYAGKLIARDLKFAIVVSRFNEALSVRLLDGALDTLKRHDAKEEDIDVVWVPGSFELPLAAKKLAESRRYNAVVCLGVVIRGETPHFEYVASEVSKGIARVNFETGVPTAYGIITADTMEQAMERSGTKAGNRGARAALSAIEMVNLFRVIGD